MDVNLVKEKCRELFKKKAEVAKAKQIKTDLENEFKSMKQELIDILEASELKTFDTGFGKVTRKVQPYAKIEDKEKLASWLKERDLFDAMYTFNATKMNSFYKEELERAKEEGNVDFDIDGMDVTSIRKDLSITGVKLND